MSCVRTKRSRKGAFSGRSARLGALTSAVLATMVTAVPLLSAPTAHAAPAAADDEPGSRFTLAVLPDTQFYSRYAQSNFEPDYGTNPFAVQTEWIADHAEELNIPFVTHLGDIVDQVNVENQWVTADAAMQTLDDAGVPYSILAGNHDVLDSTDSRFDDQYDLTAEPFVKWFGSARADGQPTEGGTDATGFNQYQIFEAEGQQFLVLALSWRASDATLDWADQVMSDHSDLPVILTTHDIIGVETDGVTGFTGNYGERLWNELIADHDQIFLTLNGHYHGAAVTERTNNAGHAVTQVLIDYQMSYEGGNGYMGLYEFDLSNNQINVRTVSPWVVSKPADSLTSYDEPVLDGSGQQFTVDIDFADRFSGFDSDFTAGNGQWPSLSDRAVDIMTDGFEGVEGTQDVAPGSSDDYVEVEGTLAHWRMSGAEGTLDENAVIEDVAGDNDLHRVPLAESGSSGAQVDDVRIAAQTYPYSASGQSVCFDGTDKQTDRFSYLSTDPDAAVNDADFSGGYTIETFVKIDSSWTIDANAWSKFLTRTGNRSQLPGMPWSQWDYTASPAALGISNLREFQWTEVGQDATAGDKTNWSGEIMVDTWSHVALVNDPETAETTMYVNGAPVLRTAQDTIGQAFNEGMPWIIGSDWVDDAATNGWNGCVGETRIVDRPLTADEWLTARPDLSGLTVAEAPTVIAADASTATISGTGTPRASVTVTVGEPDVTGTGGGTSSLSSSAMTPKSEPISAAVSSDGTWAATVPAEAISAQGTALTVTQGFGTRVSDPVRLTITKQAAGSGDSGGDNSSVGGDGQAGQGSQKAAGSQSTAGRLPSTGSDVSAWAVATAVALMLGGAVLTMRARRGSRRE